MGPPFNIFCRSIKSHIIHPYVIAKVIHVKVYHMELVFSQLHDNDQVSTDKMKYHVVNVKYTSPNYYQSLCNEEFLQYIYLGMCNLFIMSKFKYIFISLFANNNKMAATDAACKQTEAKKGFCSYKFPVHEMNLPVKSIHLI